MGGCFQGFAGTPEGKVRAQRIAVGHACKHSDSAPHPHPPNREPRVMAVETMPLARAPALARPARRLRATGPREPASETPSRMNTDAMFRDRL